MKTRCLLALAIFHVCSSLATAWDGLLPSESKVKVSLHEVIAGQLAAFRAGDFAAAYVFADRELRDQLPLERFEQMVKTGYPVIVQSVSANFGLTFDNGDEAVVNVRLTGAERQTVAYQYLLRRDGTAWRITGVLLLKDQAIEV